MRIRKVYPDREAYRPFYTTIFIIFCPGCEAMMSILASPSCTAYLWGSFPTLCCLNSKMYLVRIFKGGIIKKALSRQWSSEL